MPSALQRGGGIAAVLQVHSLKIPLLEEDPPGEKHLCPLGVFRRRMCARHKKLSEWYSKVPDEEKRQLYRRTSLYVEVEKNEIFLYEMDKHLKKTLKVTMKNAVPSLLAQKPADRQDEFWESTVKSYYTAFADDLPNEEVQSGLSSVKRNGTKEIPQEHLPF